MDSNLILESSSIKQEQKEYSVNNRPGYKSFFPSFFWFSTGNKGENLTVLIADSVDVNFRTCVGVSRFKKLKG